MFSSKFSDRQGFNSHCVKLSVYLTYQSTFGKLFSTTGIPEPVLQPPPTSPPPFVTYYHHPKLLIEVAPCIVNKHTALKKNIHKNSKTSAMTNNNIHLRLHNFSTL